MKANECSFELLSRLSESPVLLLDLSGKIIQHTKLENTQLISADGFFAADDSEALKRHLSICAKSLNSIPLAIMVNNTRCQIKGARFNPQEKKPLVVFYIIKDKSIETNFGQLNKVTELSYEVKRHIALEKKLRLQTAELKASRDKIKELAHFDPVTKLANRFHFQELLNSTLKHAKEMKHHFAVFFLDIDNFKYINDTYGHIIGDSILVKVANRIKSIARKSDSIARIGGDEFTIILDLLKSSDFAESFASRLNAELVKPYKINDIDLYASCSIGISIYPNAGNTAEDLLKHADAAMYECKKLGKNSYQLYSDEICQKNERHLLIENNLRHAIEYNELHVVYQPQYEIATNKITGVEALLRWQSQHLGNVPPDEFIPIAEKSGLIDLIGDWVTKQALSTFSEWDKLYPELQLSININCSVIQLENKVFCNRVKELINQYHVSGTRVIFEATETVLMKRISEVCDQIVKLNDLGIRIAIDDFGKGYSSLTYLKKLPVSCLKIDKSFVDDLLNDQNDVAIIKTIIQLGSSMNLEVIAEGVETKGQLDCLAKLGCTSAQGYYLSKPVTNEDFLTLLKNLGY